MLAMRLIEPSFGSGPTSAQQGASMYQLKGRSLALCLAAAASACGGAQMKESRLVEVQASIQAAEEAGAAADPKGAHLLETARRSVSESVNTADRGDVQNAELFLERAEADVELALQLARANEERTRAKEAWTEKKP
jgi:hypothetical protein